MTRLHLAVTPLLCTTITYANMDRDQPIEDLSIDPNTTSDHHPEARKIMFFDLTSNITCRHSDKIEDLCNLTEQSPLCQDSKHLTATVPTNECQFILIKLPGNDLEALNISSPDGPSTNGKNVQITISNPPNSPKTPNLVIAGTVLMVLGAALGFILGSKTNDLVTVETEVQRPPEPKQQRPPEPEQHTATADWLDTFYINNKSIN